MIDKIIDYLQSTQEDEWCTEICRTLDGKQNCLIGHIYNFGGGEMCDIFEEVYATSFMFYPVNDGEHPNYPEPTPKQRCIQYLKNLRDGKEKTTQDIDKLYEEKLGY